ncbi:hypothetical protein acsn021_02850 [Anaerocolumna cellulosilytica]|uniref:Uncharacterized protein n=1 Tax=Anaerocolumna cellulosilytica TaxID=433286 RepID=A0A6S6QSV3_9FIRM|nr:hypothetical protein acsn021_02850 [Anaerocolumna cellulosilytica]
MYKGCNEEMIVSGIAEIGGLQFFNEGDDKGRLILRNETDIRT